LKGRNVVNRTIVFKCGGSSLSELSPKFFYNMNTLINEGWKPVIVHGGGPAIQQRLEQLNISFEFVDGLRKTTDEMMDVVEMVLSGQINSQLTRLAHSYGINTVGISGTDLKLLEARPINKDKYGLVGEITYVNTDFLDTLLDKDIVPVISPIAVDQYYSRYNVNADTAAGAIAAALQAQQLVFVTDVDGIYIRDKLLEQVTPELINHLIDTGDIYGGMIPKVQAAMNSLTHQVAEVMIVNGKQSALTDNNLLKGTTILQEGIELDGTFSNI